MKKALIVLSLILVLGGVALAAEWNIGDVNNDGKVDIIDLAMVSAAFGSYVGMDRYNPACDINPIYAPIYDDTGKIVGYDVSTILGYGDGKVDIADIAIVCGNFGKYRPKSE